MDPRAARSAVGKDIPGVVHLDPVSDDVVIRLCLDARRLHLSPEDQTCYERDDQ